MSRSFVVMVLKCVRLWGAVGWRGDTGATPSAAPTVSGDNVRTVTEDLQYCIAGDMLIGPFYIHLNVRH